MVSRPIVLPTSSSPTRTATVWTRRTRIFTFVCSVIFTIGTAAQAFVIVNLDTLEQMMRLAGVSASEATDSAPGFLAGFRLVGTLFIIGNALGMLALRGRTWVFWLVVAVNAGQAAGVFMVPTEMFEAAVDRFGWIGVLPSAVTDGGALVLLAVLVVSLLRSRTRDRTRRLGNAG
ncbi:hypothetical protein [Plantactinospora soyae]|uniref:Uncharacterized protein n=1 Tax=Plantactinospora soyae TaxID=1544732 RepID=A0A927M1I3_9ACTN|nr:hypothetical protein [Plantactinospora soyae]MBE1486397.1 hypothetical protein [Plantactinospora soyae]